MKGQIVPPNYVTPIGSVTPNFPNKATSGKLMDKTPAAMGDAAMPITGRAAAAFSSHKANVARAAGSFGRKAPHIAKGVSGENGHMC